MGRLTYEKLCDILQHVNRVTFILDEIGEESYSSQEVHEAIKELQRYKDLEEQGRLLKLKFKLGQKVYDVRYEEDGHHSWYEIREWSFREDMYNCQDRYYATKEEAERKLKELEDD